MPGPLDNPRHERFCQLVVEVKENGAVRSDAEAYQIAYGCDVMSARTNSWRLRADEGIVNRIKELHGKTALKSILSRQESLEFLASIVRTAPGSVDETSPLCQSYKVTEGGTEYKMPSKLDALTLNAKLQGFLVEKTEHTVRLSVFGGDLPTERPAIDIASEVLPAPQQPELTMDDF